MNFKEFTTSTDSDAIIKYARKEARDCGIENEEMINLFALAFIAQTMAAENSRENHHV